MEDKDKVKRGFQIALGATIFQIFLSVLFYFLYVKVKSPLLLTETFHVVIGIPIFSSLFLLFQQRYKEFLEREEVEEIAKKEGKIFRDEETSILVSRIRLKQTEKWIIPGITLILSFFLIYTPIKIIYYFHGKSILYKVNPVIPLLLIGLTFVIFLFSRYILGVSRESLRKDLRCIGSFLGINAIFSFLIAICLALTDFGLPKVEWFIFYLLNIFLIFIGIEYLLNIIVSFYRAETQEKRLPFDSRTMYLLSTPEEVIPSFSEIIDYQFGFRITQTWFYQFIRKRLIPLFLLDAFLFYSLTCIVIIKPYERGFIEIFGKPVNGGEIFGPGIHFKPPWPIGKVRLYDVDRVKSIRVGAKGKEGERILWTERHYEKEYNWIIASKEELSSSSTTTVPVNFLAGVIWVYYQVNPKELFDYAYRNSEPDKVLEGLVYNQFTKMVMSVGFFDIINVKRLSLIEKLKEDIQKEVDKHHLGIRIVVVSLGGVHPPVEVAPSFEKVVGAMETKEAYILGAESYRNREVTLANYNASTINTEAKSYKFVRGIVSQSRGEEFLEELKAYEKNPRIFKYRHYLRALEKSLISPRKYVVLSSKRRNVTIIDLEKPSLPEFLPLGGGKKKE